MKRFVLGVLCIVFSMTTVLAQDQNIKGVVLDDTGETVIGATVTVKGTTNGVMTDIEGNFSIKAKIGDLLVVKSIGYEDQEVKAAANLKVILATKSEQLQEVVITGMTQMDKRLFTGAADKLSADDVKLDGLADVSRALEGRSAGVSVQNVSGTFGAAPKIRVRGATSIYGSSKPLWVVDGVIMEDIVEVSADDLSSGDPVTLISSAIAGLNADDIESFDILKDGSATSLYGARAMSGVIVVTTKKGKAGVSKISYTGEFTMRMKPRYSNFSLMNSQDQMGVYKEMRDKGWLNLADVSRRAETGVYGKMYQMMGVFDPVTGNPLLENTPEARNGYLRDAEMRNTDWFDELFSNSLMHNHSVSISTGTERATTYASVSAMVDPGWYKKSKMQRYTANLNTTFKILPTLTLNLITNGSYRKQKAPGTLSQDVDNVNGAVKRDFDINPYSYGMNSSRALHPESFYTSNYAPFNILHELDNNYMDLSIADLKFQGEMKWFAIPELQFSVLGALKYKTTSQEHHVKDMSNQALAYRAMGDATIRDKNPLLYKNPDDPYALPISILPEGGIYTTKDYKMLGYDFRLAGTWNKTFNKDHITFLYGGMEINSTDRNDNRFEGWGLQYEMGEVPFYVYEFIKKRIEENNNYFAKNVRRSRQVSFVASPSYSYKGKYTISGTVRYEGTNRLGKSNSSRWLPTWNISGAWNAHEEDFFEKVTPTLSHLTLKASYSLMGENPANSVTNSRMIIRSSTPYRPFAQDKEGALRIADLENSELTYEKKKELNIGLDLGFLDNKINLGLDWYTRNNYDLIGRISTTGVGGIVDKYANVAKMNSHGIEVSLATTNMDLKSVGFKWNTNFVFSYAKSKVKDLLGTTPIMDLISGEGFALEGYENRALFSYRFNGLSKDGIPTFVDSKGEEINPNEINFQKRTDVLDIIKYEGPSEAPFTGGFGNMFTFKNFKLNVFMTYAFGNKVRLDPVFKTKYDDLTAMTKDFKNRWTLPGDEARTNIPVILNTRQEFENRYLTRAYSAYNYSDTRIASGSFIRMKEISVAYDVPKTYLPKSITNASVKLQATNLFLIYSDKKLNGQDPEFFRSGGVSAPVPKQFTLTVRVSM